MSRRFPLLAVAVLLASVVWCAAPSSGQEQEAKTLTAKEAAEHVGEVATVCGKVASATYAARSRGRPTFLNLDEPYPVHDLPHVCGPSVKCAPLRGAWDEPP